MRAPAPDERGARRARTTWTRRVLGALGALLAGAASAPLAAQPAAAAATPGAAAVVREGHLKGAGGVRIFYRVVGRGADTVVVVHGGPGAGLGSVAPDLEAMAERHVLVHFDQRGSGRSELPQDTALLRAERVVADLEALRRHFKLDRMTLLAHASGALVAARYAEAHPGRVARMVFVGAIGPRLPDAAAYARAVHARMDGNTARTLAGLVRALKSDTTSDVAAVCREYERVFRAVAAPRGRAAQEPAAQEPAAQEPAAQEQAPRERGTSCDAPPQAIRYANRFTSEVTFDSFGAWDFSRSLGAVQAPLLVLYGDRDPRSIPAQRVWAAAVPNGRLLVVPGAGRAPHVDRPDVFFPAVDAFLAGGWPEGTIAPPR